MMRRFALAVGDTAGHVIPAIVIAEAYRRRYPDSEARFFAAGEGAGHWLIGQSGFAVDYVPGSQIARASRIKQVVALGRAAAATLHARRLLRHHGSRLVIGTGGYGSAATILAARSLGLRTALIEPNVSPGLANRLLGHVAHRAYVAFEETAARFPAGTSLVTGVPLRPTLAERTGSRSAPVLPHLRLLVMSGSRGEEFLGAQVPLLCQDLQSRGLVMMVRHQGGAATARIQTSYDRAGVNACVEPFIADVGKALNWADIAITRAGAGTIAELAASGVPALLVPLGDAAHDHQAVNAAALVSRGAAWMARERDWQTAVVAPLILEAVGNPRVWESMSRATRALADHDATKQILDDCERLMKGRW